MDYLLDILLPDELVDRIEDYKNNQIRHYIDFFYPVYGNHCTLMRLKGAHRPNESAIIAALGDIKIRPFDVMTGIMDIFDKHSLVVLLGRADLLRLHQEIFDRLNKYSGDKEALKHFGGEYYPHITICRVMPPFDISLINRIKLVGHVLPVNEFRLVGEEITTFRLRKQSKRI